MNRRQLLTRAGLALGVGVTGLPATAPTGTIWKVFTVDRLVPSFEFTAKSWEHEDGIFTFHQSDTKSLTFSLRYFEIGTNLEIRMRGEWVKRPFFAKPPAEGERTEKYHYVDDLTDHQREQAEHWTANFRRNVADMWEAREA